MPAKMKELLERQFMHKGMERKYLDGTLQRRDKVRPCEFPSTP